jgi:redox-sensitive bicupin YhaK (pirin superfamily)
MNSLSRIEISAAAGRIGDIVSGTPHVIGSGFTARHFSEEMYRGRMDPLLMVDHFEMTAPTFDPHLHAGLSAVTMMFEESEGGFMNRDTLGNTVRLVAGDLYWLAAASGAAHEEKPEPGAHVRALQIFVNLPARLKTAPARALHVRAGDVPVLEGEGHRVRVLLGRSGGAVGLECTPEEMTMLDGYLAAGGSFAHALGEGRQAWLYGVSGSMAVRSAGEEIILAAGQSVTVAAGEALGIEFEAQEPAHFVLMAARPIREPFVKGGPLVMATAEDVRRTLAGYAEGRFGRIPA